MSSSSFVLDASYGKQSVPVFKIIKNGATHSVIDMVVQIMLEGDVSRSWLEGENSQIVPTETQKNTCYALAALTDFDCCEEYGMALGRDMLQRHAHLSKVTLDLSERIWDNVQVSGRRHNHMFTSPREPERRIARVVVSRSEGVSVSGGFANLKIMKTTQSGFAGFVRDKYTNLQPVGGGDANASPDRILCTEATCEWTFSRGGLPAPHKYAEVNRAIRQRIFEVWGGPPDRGIFSKSLQETAYNVATTILNEFPFVDSIFMVTPNVHFYTYPLQQFGIPNPNVVFQSTDPQSTASGRIVTRLSRSELARARL